MVVLLADQEMSDIQRLARRERLTLVSGSAERLGKRAPTSR